MQRDHATCHKFKISHLTSRTLKVIPTDTIMNRWAVNEYHFLLVACCYNMSDMQHSFWDITKFLVYMTACDLEKSFTYDNKI